MLVDWLGVLGVMLIWAGLFVSPGAWWHRRQFCTMLALIIAGASLGLTSWVLGA